MSTTETSTKAPTDTPPVTEVLASVDGPDGQSVPIEITLNQQPTEAKGSVPAQDGAGRLRAWPVALFGTEAASTGVSAAYAAAGTAGVLTAAGVAAGGGLIAAGVAAYRSRTPKPKRPSGRVLRSSGPRTTSNAPSGRGRSEGRGSGAGLGMGSGRNSHGRGRSSGLGAVSSGASSPRGGSRPSSTSSTVPTRTGPVLNRMNKRAGGSGAGAGGFAGRSQSGATSGPGAGLGSGGRGGLLRRLSQRRNGGGGAGSGSLSKDRGPGGGRGGAGRSTVGAWSRRAARSGMRALAKTVGAGRAARDSATGRALSDRIRSGRRGLVKKGKAGVRFVLRSAAAKVAAGAVGALALIPGLLLRTGAAAMGSCGCCAWPRAPGPSGGSTSPAGPSTWAERCTPG